MKTSYIAIAVFSLIPALILAFFLISGLQSSIVTDLAWITFLFLILNFVLSLTLLFVEEKFKRVENRNRKAK